MCRSRTTELIVQVQNRIFFCAFHPVIEKRGRKTADASAYNHAVVGLARVMDCSRRPVEDMIPNGVAVGLLSLCAQDRSLRVIYLIHAGFADTNPPPRSKKSEAPPRRRFTFLLRSHWGRSPVSWLEVQAQGQLPGAVSCILRGLRGAENSKGAGVVDLC